MDAHRLYLETISGQRQGLWGPLARLGLSACVPFYDAAARLNRLMYDHAWRNMHRVPVPVISVGNLSTGGTGKTPTVAWIVNRLLGQGVRPGILSRGYKSLDDAGNDEKRLLDAICPGVPHIQNRDRVAGARQAAGDHNCEVLVLDDGFQHRRLHRDLDIVLIDAVNPWGHRHLLPRGLLREPPGSLCRADLVIMTRSNQVESFARESLRREISRWTKAPVCDSSFESTGWVGDSGEAVGLEMLRGRRAAAFCGIGNPEGFSRSLAGIGMNLTDSQWRIFPDHYHYDSREIRRLNEWADAVGAECLVTTRKDLVKVPRLNRPGRPIWALDIEMAFHDPGPVICRLDALIGDRAKRRAA